MRGGENWVGQMTKGISPLKHLSLVLVSELMGKWELMYRHRYEYEIQILTLTLTNYKYLTLPTTYYHSLRLYFIWI
jgi:hypothetical protein